MATIRDILVDAGFKIAFTSGKYYRMKPIHRSSDNNSCFSVHSETGRYYDFVTHESGDISDLIKGITGKSVTIEERAANRISDLKDEINIVFNSEDIQALLPSYQFYTSKGISVETLKYFKSGFCNSGKMHDRYVFPIINPDGSIVGLSGRAIRPKPTDPEKAARWIKWKHLGEKSKWVYPYYFNHQYIKDEVILVESHGNMLALWEAGYKNVLISAGTSFSRALLAAIIVINPKRIIVAFDNDEGKNPGQVNAMKAIGKLEKWFDKSKIVNKLTPTGVDLMDLWQSEGKAGIQKWYEHS